MNVNRSGSGTSLGTDLPVGAGKSPVTGKVGVVFGALLLLAAGSLLLVSGSRPHAPAVNASTQVSRSSFQSSPLQNAILSAGSPSLEGDIAAQLNPPNSNRQTAGSATAVLSHLPLLFEPNVGQMNPSDSSVKFVARGGGYSLLLDSQGATLALLGKTKSGSSAKSFVHMKLAGANSNTHIAGANLLPGKSNYFIGNDPAKWHAGIPQFASVGYEQIYPGIDLIFYGNQGQLEYDFKVAPGADPSQAQLQFDGSQKLELSSGSLILRSDAGDLRFNAPKVYQVIDGRRQPVEGRFALRAANRVGFELGTYDHNRELVIDPILSYATFFGGTGNDQFPSIAVDILGNLYLTGSTTSPNLPTTTGAFQTALDTPSAQNIFVLKLNPLAGTSGIEYLTYLGGSGIDAPVGIGTDGNNIYVAGTTSSGNFPTTGNTAYQTAPKAGSAGPNHVFVSVLNTANTGTAQLAYSTYLSGSGDDIASGMTVDTNGNVYLTGTTTSTAVSDEGSFTNSFPATYVQQPFQAISRGNALQFFVTKVYTQGAGTGSIPYSTYFGGDSPTNVTAVGGQIAVDSSGNIYFTGTTNFIYTGNDPTTDFPILNAYQPCLDQTPPLVIVTGIPVCTYTSTGPLPTDAFVAKLNNPTVTNQGTQLGWSTYFGGANTETGTGIVVDAGAANVYITGATNSSTNCGGSQCFILQTTLGQFAPFQLCLGTFPNPTNGTCPAPAANPQPNAYVARFNNPATGTSATTPTVVALTYFSYLGGTGPDTGLAIAVDPSSDALITGSTQSPNFPVFPTSNASCSPPSVCVLQPTLLSTATPPQNAFFARLNTTALTGQQAVGDDVTYYGGTGTDRGTGIAIDQNLNVYFAGDTTSPTLQTVNPLQAANGGPSGTFDTFVVQLGTAADLAISNAQLSNPTLSNQVPVGTQVSTVYTITNNGPDPATNVVVLGLIPSGTTFNSANATSGSCSTTVTSGQVACTISQLQAGSTATVTIVLTPNQPGTYMSSASVSASNNIDPLPGNNNGSVNFAATAFVLSVTPNAVTVPAAGDTAFYTVTVTPQPVYGAAVSLTVTGLPNATKSTYSAPSLTLTSASPASSTLAISTTARPINIGNARPGRGALYAAFLVFPAMAFIGLGGRNKRRRRLAGLWLLGMLFGLIWLQPACSGGTTAPIQGGTPPGTYNLVISASGGTYSKNQTVELVVP